MRNQVGLNNFNKLPQEGYNTKTENKQLKNNERSQI